MPTLKTLTHEEAAEIFKVACGLKLHCKIEQDKLQNIFFEIIGSRHRIYDYQDAVTALANYMQ